MKKVLLVMVFFLAACGARAAAPDGSLLDGIAPGPDGKIDVLTVFAHEDDETIYGGGALIKMKQDPRVRLTILCLTLGDKSSAMKRLDITEEEQGRIRSAELRLAATVLGADEVVQFDYHDQGLTFADQDEIVNKIKDVMDRVGPEIVITHGPGGVTGHPDHVTCSAAATRAFNDSGAQRLYYPVLPPSLRGLRFVLGPEAVRHPEPKPTLRVDISAEKKLKRLAMYSHVTQHEFSEVGLSMDIIRHYNHEWFALGGTH